ncbi:hypothetical protein Esti_005536 [Eimeria stiedai]
MASQDRYNDATLCLLPSEHESTANAIKAEADELLRNCEALDAEAVDFLHAVAAKTAYFEKQQLNEVGERFGEWLQPREGEKRLQQLALRCRELQERFRRQADCETQIHELFQNERNCSVTLLPLVRVLSNSS